MNSVLLLRFRNKMSELWIWYLAYIQGLGGRAPDYFLDKKLYFALD